MTIHTNIWSAYAAERDARRREHQQIDRFTMLAIVMNILDALTTFYALSSIAGATEANPVMAWVIHTLGLPSFVVAKVLIGTLAVAHTQHIARWGHKHQWMNRRPWLTRCTDAQARRDARRMLVGFSIIFSTIVVNNAIAIIRYT